MQAVFRSQEGMPVNTRARFAALAAALAPPGLLGCAATHVPLARLRPPCALSLADDRILCDGVPYAEIVKRHCTHEAGGGPHPARSGRACRGLGIRYADGSRVTVFAARSLDLWTGADAYAARSKSEAIGDWAYDIQLDLASHSVIFRRRGIFSASRWAYDVGTGCLIEVD
jgi:hypothetical protein